MAWRGAAYRCHSVVALLVAAITVLPSRCADAPLLPSDVLDAELVRMLPAAAGAATEAAEGRRTSATSGLQGHRVVSVASRPDSIVAVGDLRNGSAFGGTFVTRHAPADGSLVWTRVLNTKDGASYQPRDVALGADGSALVVGAVFESDPLAGWIAKFSAGGLPLWTRRLQTGAGAGATAVTSADDGSAFVSGSLTSSDAAASDETRVDAFLVKYTRNGDLAWARSFGGRVNTSACCVAAVGSNVYIAGRMAAQDVGMWPSSFLAKYSEDGKREWARQTGLGAHETITSISTSLDGAVYVTGSSIVNVSSGEKQAFLAKYAADGERLWARFLRMRGRVAIHALSTGVDDGSAGFAVAAVGSIEHGGSVDALISAFSSQGNLEWARSLNTSSGMEDTAVGAATSASGSLVVATSSGGAAAGARAFLTRYSSTGDYAWTLRINATAASSASGGSGAGAFELLGADDSGSSLSLEGLQQALAAKLPTTTLAPTPAPADLSGGIGGTTTSTPEGSQLQKQRFVMVSAARGLQQLVVLSILPALMFLGVFSHKA
eukprot:TRINITY_DN28830_c0_g1_i2.p1 TRINITY_DN28830_c0_g1~~TRINITY_DN28830_c0_g1_i2.p1  ORF type:complete len:564 (-),score=101.28 TRINITY_DN28830_c0_g1_i2:74-1720(-)